MLVLAIDTSIRSTGVALFRNRTLECASVVKMRACHSESRIERCRRMASEISAWSGPVQSLICEWPQVYRAAKSKGDPNDLLWMAGVACALSAQLLCNTLSPTPAEWIGQLPKATAGDPWESPRGRRIVGRLTETERAVVPAQHDAIDAVGLGLWALGRLAPRRVYPGAT